MTPIFELKKFQEEALRSGDITLEGIIKKVDSESPFQKPVEVSKIFQQALKEEPAKNETDKPATPASKSPPKPKYYSNIIDEEKPDSMQPALKIVKLHSPNPRKK